MPELPEVETTRQGIEPFVVNQTITQIIIRNSSLRLPVPQELNDQCKGQQIQTVKRRAKYLLLQLTNDYHLMIHLGMSGHLRIADSHYAPRKHDHIDMHLTNQVILRYNDPRRFGLWLLLKGDPMQHPLLAHLGPEPLSNQFDAFYLAKRAENRKQSIKNFIMDNTVVVGVGNIYASESLFLAGLHPATPAGQVNLSSYQHLVEAIKYTLSESIKAGGTSLKDFYNHDGKPGYFSHHLKVYGRQQQACYQCQNKIETIRLGGRASCFCPHCQPLI